MSAKIVRKDGKRLTIEITVDLEESMLGSEEAIQVSVNEAGALASEEALKHKTRTASLLKLKVKLGVLRDRKRNVSRRPMARLIRHDMSINTKDEVKRFAL